MTPKFVKILTASDKKLRGITITQLVQGVPNNGVPCADSMANYPDTYRDKLKVAQELMPDAMARFNQFVTNRRGTKFTALIDNAVRLHCASLEQNDEFVSVNSAKYGVEDFVFTSRRHKEMIDNTVFGDFIKPRVLTGPHGTYLISLKNGQESSSSRLQSKILRTKILKL